MLKSTLEKDIAKIKDIAKEKGFTLSDAESLAIYQLYHVYHNFLKVETSLECTIIDYIIARETIKRNTVNDQ